MEAKVMKGQKITISARADRFEEQAVEALESVTKTQKRRVPKVSSTVVETTDDKRNSGAFSIPRQVARQLSRMKAKQQRSTEMQKDCRDAAKALRERQSRREKEGFYDGQRSTVSNMTGSRKTPDDKRKISKGRPFGRILRTVNEMSYHATRGWIRYVAE